MTPRSSRWPLGASTLGAIEEDLPAVVDIMTRHGATAVELRTAEDAPVNTDLDPDQRGAVRSLFRDAGIEILSIASRIRVAATGDDAAVLTALRDHLGLAADLGAPFVRVFPGAPTLDVRPDAVPELAEPEAEVDERAARRLATLVDEAGRLGVKMLLETHDSHPRGTDVARVLSCVAQIRPGHEVGALWDVLHPWRVGEPLEGTAAKLLPYVLDGRGYVQIKDVAAPDHTTPVLQGRGTVPGKLFLELLDAGGYTGPVSLEWERHWYPHVEPLAAALEAVATFLRAPR